MSGHSKWANIKRKKGKSDAAKGKVFTKIGREIAVAVRQGGSDPESNSKLRDVIAKAKANNLPNENIMRGIKKAAGEAANVNYEEIIYEGYGTNGVAVIVECLTDNKNRTAGDVRHLFDKFGGALGSTNCVSFMFTKKGIIAVERTPKILEDRIMEDALEAGADDVQTLDDAYEIYTDPFAFSKVREFLEKKKYEFINAEVDYIPANRVKLEGESAEKFLKLLENFDDLDDVQNVYHNADLPEEEEEDE